MRSHSVGLRFIPFAFVLVCASAAPAQIVRQVTDGRAGLFGRPALNDSGSEVWLMSSEDGGSNAEHGYQIVRYDSLSGVETAVTSVAGGLGFTFHGLSVSDDAQWVAFISTADLTGQNHDRSAEVFVMMRDGSQLAQLTNDPTPNGGSAYEVQLAGSGNRVAFVSNSDLLGTNPFGLFQLFVIDRTGANLRQLTHGTFGEIKYVTISDDGLRLAFTHNGDLTGGNPEWNWEIYAVQHDGTGLVQRTVTTGVELEDLFLSGGGARIAYSSTAGNIHVIGWSAGGATLLAAGTDPSISDDGQFVYFATPSNQIAVIRATGGAVTTLAGLPESGLPIVSGSGSYVAFRAQGTAPGGSNPDGGEELLVMKASGADLLQLTDTVVTGSTRADISADGLKIAYTTDAGSDRKLFVRELDGPTVTLLSDSDAVHEPSISGDGSVIAFHDSFLADVFRVQSDGSGLTQLTTCPGGNGFSRGVQISADASLIVFHSLCNFTGQNADGTGEIFSIDALGTIRQITVGPGPGGGLYNYFPRVDASGEWIVFTGNGNPFGSNPGASYEVWRIRSDGSGFQKITADPVYYSVSPDISADGSRILFISRADHVGQNPDHNSELFVYEPNLAQIRQITMTADRDHYASRISGNGEWGYFLTDLDYAESDPDRYYDAFRIHLDTGEVQRVSGLAPGRFPLIEPGYALASEVDASGDRAVHPGDGDLAETNPDQHREIWLTDQTKRPSIRLSGAAPTVVSWDVESGPIRYDVIRGSLSALDPGPGGTVDLGTVVCLENDSADPHTLGFADLDDPAPGQAFFYIYAGSHGLAAPPASYGASSGGEERVPSSGGCPG